MISKTIGFRGDVQKSPKQDIYPLANSHNYMEKSTMFYLGKSTISMAIFYGKIHDFQTTHFQTHPCVDMEIFSEIGVPH